MIACLDLEGVLIPEIWINFAEKTKIAELSLTTRDIPDYDVLMKKRLGILKEHGLTIHDIQEVIQTLKPLEGAPDFLHWLRQHFQVIILSDTFYQFAAPLMKQLGYPTLFCHHLDIDPTGHIKDYRLRLKDQKREAVKKLHALNFKVMAAGDSYNDISMLREADAGILFRPPDNVIQEFPQFPVTKNYQELQAAFEAAADKIMP